MSDQELRAAANRPAGLTLERQLALWAAALLAIVAIFYFLSSVLTPFIAGIALGYLLDPVADRLQRAGLSRLGASLLILSIFLFLLSTVVLLIAPVLTRQLTDFIESLPGYLTTLQGLLASLGQNLTGDFAKEIYEKLGLGTPDAPFDVQKYVNDIASEAARMAASFLRSLVSGGAALVNVLALIVITPVVAFYILLDWDKLLASIDSLVPPRHRAAKRSFACFSGSGTASACRSSG
jgi:predicted PurR-regulated permease PerM